MHRDDRAQFAREIFVASAARFRARCSRLCLASGGPSGMLYFSALRFIFDDDPTAFAKWRISVCREIAGCSIGSLVGLCICLGVDWLSCLPFCIGSPLSPSDLRILIIRLLESRGVSPHCTMRELHAFSRIDFRTSCTDSTSGTSFIFSSTYTPDALVVDAVAHSCAVPLLLHDGHHHLYDGMFADNYAITAFSPNDPLRTFAICMDLPRLYRRPSRFSAAMRLARISVAAQFNVAVSCGAFLPMHVFKIRKRIPWSGSDLGSRISSFLRLPFPLLLRDILELFSSEFIDQCHAICLFIISLCTAELTSRSP